MAAVLAKAITYAATFGAAGGIFFLRYSDDLITDAQRAQLQRIIRAFAGAAVFASAARISMLAGSMEGSSEGMFNRSFIQMIIRAGEGPATAIRIAGLWVAGHALFSRRRAGTFAIGGAIVAAMSFAWVGHPRATGLVLPPLLEGAHLVCVAFWLGALVPLLVIARQPDAPRTAAVAARFGHIAVWVLAMLIAVGTALIWILIGDVAQLWSSAYGRALLTKLLLVAILLGLAAFNKLRLIPHLRLDGSRAARSLARSIRFELVLGVLILLVTASLTTLWGPAALE